jgi:hypothetical protein
LTAATPSDEARFELLGILACAQMYNTDRGVIETIARYVASPASTSSNGIMDKDCGGYVVSVRSDVRSGSSVFPPTVDIDGVDLPQTIVDALAGRAVSTVIGGWLDHPGLIIDEATVMPATDQRGPRLALKIRPTRLTLSESARIVAETAHTRDQLRHLKDDEKAA